MDIYERKYKEALERAKELSKTITGANYEHIFPELKESEDERIRKTLVELVKCNERCGYFMINNITTSAMLAWLEKQGEQKPLFKVGDKIRTKDAPEFTYTILEIKDGDYICNTCDFGIDNPNLELVEE